MICLLSNWQIRTAIDTRFVISDIKDGLKTNADTLTSAIETSQRHIILDIDKHANDIYEEIRTWGMSQSSRADKLSAEVRNIEGTGLL